MTRFRPLRSIKMWLKSRFRELELRSGRKATAEYRFSFPEDHGRHSDFSTEWWYVSGNLVSDGRIEWGYQFAIFRHRPSLGLNGGSWLRAPVDGYVGQLIVTNCNVGRFGFAERHGSPILRYAGALESKLDTWVGDWSMRNEDGVIRVQGTERGFGIDLNLYPSKPPVLNGIGGLSVKASEPTGASHHYSVTSIDTKGTITWEGSVCPAKGKSWLDREFGSHIFPEAVQGWDWFSLRLGDHSEIMIFIVRFQGNEIAPTSYGTYVSPAADSEGLKAEDFCVTNVDFWTSPRSLARYPIAWRVEVPRHAIELTVVAVVKDHEINSSPFWRIDYWEGPVRIDGRKHSRPVKGSGHVELTGYADPIGGKF